MEQHRCAPRRPGDGRRRSTPQARTAGFARDRWVDGRLRAVRGHGTYLAGRALDVVAHAAAGGVETRPELARSRGAPVWPDSCARRRARDNVHERVHAGGSLPRVATGRRRGARRRAPRVLRAVRGHRGADATCSRDRGETGYDPTACADSGSQARRSRDGPSRRTGGRREASRAPLPNHPEACDILSGVRTRFRTSRARAPQRAESKARANSHRSFSVENIALRSGRCSAALAALRSGVGVVRD